VRKSLAVKLAGDLLEVRVDVVGADALRGAVGIDVLEERLPRELSTSADDAREPAVV
jgi:hypothetical protein